MLEHLAFNIDPVSRKHRVSQAKAQILDGLNLKQKEFIEFVLFKYIDSGVGELEQSKLPELIELKYHTIADATEVLGGVNQIRNLFVNFQKYLYQ